MSSPRKNQYLLKSQVLALHVNKNIKKIRQSEPNFLREDQFQFSLNRSKEEVNDKKQKLERKPRLSEVSNSMIQIEIHSPQHITAEQASRQCFHSPNYIKKPTLMFKSPSSKYFNAQPINSLSKTQTLKPNNKKHAIQSHKQTLNKIEQMLLNHGIQIKDSKKNNQIKEESVKKVKKYPRFSQDNVYQPEDKIQKQKKQNQCLDTRFVISQQDEQQNLSQLKQTISTHCSVKNLKQFKITDFQVGKQLGRGKFGIVKIAKHKKTGMLFSMKIIKKSTVIKEKLVEQLIKQIKIQSILNQANIIKLYSFFDDSQNVYLLLELCPEGNLYQYMQKNKKLSQNQTKVLIKSICEGVEQLHLNNVIHRDLKPQNIVLCYGMAKICDFGWSTQYRDVMRETFCGTPLYVSPQLLSGNSYDQKVDLWAIGILGFEMLTGKIPFEIKNEKDLYKIISSKIIFPNTMSVEAISFLQSLLVRDPINRTSITQILRHPFVTKK